jgi:hypothetical protein
MEPEVALPCSQERRGCLSGNCFADILPQTEKCFGFADYISKNILLYITSVKLTTYTFLYFTPRV